MADHVRALPAPRPQSTAGKLSGATQWLFPGNNPGRHMNATSQAARLRAVGVYTSTARQTSLAHVAATMPAAIVADLMGVSINTAVNWSSATARTRADYSENR
jgi:hypothetical protein